MCLAQYKTDMARSRTAARRRQLADSAALNPQPPLQDRKNYKGKKTDL